MRHAKKPAEGRESWGGLLCCKNELIQEGVGRLLWLENIERAKNSGAKENVSLENSQHFSLARWGTQTRKSQDVAMVRSLRWDEEVVGKPRQEVWAVSSGHWWVWSKGVTWWVLDHTKWIGEAKKVFTRPRSGTKLESSNYIVSGFFPPPLCFVTCCREPDRCLWNQQEVSSHGPSHFMWPYTTIVIQIFLQDGIFKTL